MSNNQPIRITEKALCMSVSFRRWGIHRKIGVTPDAETAADKKLLRTTKRLLEAPEYKAISSIDGEIKGMLRRRCVAFPMRDSIWLVPIETLPEVERALEEAVAQRTAAVETLIAAMPRIREESQARLADLFNERDYPGAAEMRARFRVETMYVSMDVPGQLAQIDSALFDNERRKAEARWAEATDEIRYAMREAFAGLVKNMVDKLTPDADGKKKVFRDSLVENLREFIDGFATRNLTNDAELAELVDQARSITNGLDPARLRKGDGSRFTVAAQMSQVAAKLDTMICAAPARRFAFDEE